MSMSAEIFKELSNAIDSGQSVAVATIARRSGSSPRDVGAKMLIYSDGAISGTIGGGKFEAQVIKDSMELLRGSEKVTLKHYSFSKDGKNALGMTCGGEAEVFIELFRAPARLYIFGGGHVGRELARLAAGSNFVITVVDDRPEILADYENQFATLLAGERFLDNLPVLGSGDYIVVITKSHESDREIVKRYIGDDRAYLGMMGSRAKIQQVFAWLKENGISEGRLGRIHTPIGLDIGAEGPYEIAIAILAELIAVRNKIGSPKE